MTAKLTAAEAYDDMPRGGTRRYCDLTPVGRDFVDEWFASLRARIEADAALGRQNGDAALLAEKDAEIGRLRADLDEEKEAVEGWIALAVEAKQERDAARQERDALQADAVEQADRWQDAINCAEDYQKSLKERIAGLESEAESLRSDRDTAREQRNCLQAELDRLKPKPPKPRKTAGEKLIELLEDVWGTSDFPHGERSAQQLAITLQSPLLTDDPATPSDGELFERACLHTRRDGGKAITHDWNESAAEFLRLRAERDGESRNVAEEQIAALVNFLSQDGANRPLSLKHPVGSAIRYITELEKHRDGGAT